MSNFRFRVREATKLLTVGEAQIKYRLQQAITTHLIFANVPEDADIPPQFRKSLGEILDEFRQMDVGYWKKKNQTISNIAAKVWDLFNEFEEYETFRCNKETEEKSEIA